MRPSSRTKARRLSSGVSASRSASSSVSARRPFRRPTSPRRSSISPIRVWMAAFTEGVISTSAMPRNSVESTGVEPRTWAPAWANARLRMAEKGSLRAPVIFMAVSRAELWNQGRARRFGESSCPWLPLQSRRLYSAAFVYGGRIDMSAASAPVAIIMGSRSDWPILRHAAEMLDALGVAYEAKVVSAHRTPERMYHFAKGAKAAGFKVIIAAAGGAAHLPGMTASLTELPVLGVPIESKALKGMDSLLSIVQMPAGIPVGTLAIGEAGAKNAGLMAAKILALSDEAIAARLAAFTANQTDSIPETVEDR